MSAFKVRDEAAQRGGVRIWHLVVISPAPVTVLLIDDTEDIRVLLRLRMELDGRFEVVGEAGDGAAGVRMAERLLPAAVVLDYMMPVLDGLGALPLLRRALPDAVLLMFSSRGSGDAADKARVAGASAYLEKSAGADEVIATLAELCGV